MYRRTSTVITKQSESVAALLTLLSSTYPAAAAKVLLRPGCRRSSRGLVKTSWWRQLAAACARAASADCGLLDASSSSRALCGLPGAQPGFVGLAACLPAGSISRLSRGELMCRRGRGHTSAGRPPFWTLPHVRPASRSRIMQPRCTVEMLSCTTSGRC